MSARQCCQQCTAAHVSTPSVPPAQWVEGRAGGGGGPSEPRKCRAWGPRTKFSVGPTSLHVLPRAQHAGSGATRAAAARAAVCACIASRATDGRAVCMKAGARRARWQSVVRDRRGEPPSPRAQQQPRVLRCRGACHPGSAHVRGSARSGQRTLHDVCTTAAVHGEHVVRAARRAHRCSCRGSHAEARERARLGRPSAVWCHVGRHRSCRPSKNGPPHAARATCSYTALPGTVPSGTAPSATRSTQAPRAADGVLVPLGFPRHLQLRADAARPHRVGDAAAAGKDGCAPMVLRVNRGALPLDRCQTVVHRVCSRPPP